MSLLDLSPEQRADLAAQVRKQYHELQAKGLQLDLTRGKPSAEQLDFSRELLSLPGDACLDSTGADVRNYGNLRGVADIRRIWGDLLGVDPQLLIAGDASSLNIMFDLISFAYTWGTPDSPRPWSQEETVKWICPVPGYDRHFTITETFGFEMIPVPMLDDGPDMEAIRTLVQDPQVKGMWTVPVFGNPTGVTFSEDTTRALAEMDTAAPDFRIVWDNAYAVHTLTEDFPEIHNVLEFAEQAGHPDRFWWMSSTSKITHAGAGVSFFASSPENLDWYTSLTGVRGIGPNKVNQLAHALFFRDAEGVRALMRKHAASLAPKFDRVLGILQERLGTYDVARWTSPQGGYFISLDVLDGTAARVVELAREAGIALTGAGSSFPLHRDPHDRNIRLAPSLPPVEEVAEAMDGVATCVLLAAVEKLGA
ncbi:aminotransferase class I/II-fold pyridoxal phosphate-dependent enzyme [Corynebacterium sp. zg-331]|uniref:aminotransferase class I/II-fold pyridoxal phosphate-dependent enzyme n=1 Tax=unclassified Corynebacterium TaxID=2624378 RepID=UPI00128D1B19|nr:MULTISPECIES: aminotransferase class I/II-fold pyridoxal phosphate-dependent enzyme [unclassified Corynebacterium]MBC3185756.1 aminotransferase class I/II-fold pyridoxal phosphate-dependent enzyme [Corynebacterium sp. zg-331]MPV52249.1 aminotransferase class I/II-fold pyridoxal phosphate-dependent enzyme [Corynebacterium sp. zg331]